MSGRLLRRRLFGAIAACAACAGFAHVPVRAEGEGASTMSHIGGFDHITTSKFDFNLNSGDFVIPGHFTATRSGTDVTADQATGNSKSKIMHAQGHVVVHQNQALAGHGDNTAKFTERPSTLTCDKLDVDGTRKLFTATGNMHFVQEGGREATSDTAVLDDANHHLHMEGHVHVRNGEQTVDADVLDYDTQTGQLDGNGDVTITAPVETAQPGPPGSPKPKKKRRITLPGT
jgi:lipopolysaccharide assembly outer membrane protein LptD (OstA)